MRLYVANIADYSKILMNEEVKDFVVINFGLYFKSARENIVF